MPRVHDDSPRIQLRLFKTVARTSLDGQTAVSTRYKGQSASIDLTPFLQLGSSVRTTKTIRDAAGGFAITFADRPQRSWSAPTGTPTTAKQLETVYGLVEPMDMIEIRMWRGRGVLSALVPDGRAQSDYPVVMRGFVSQVERNIGISDDGKPMRTVTVTGQDYGKIWQIFQVLHLAAYAQNTPLLTTFALSELFGLGAVNSLAAPDFVRTMVEKILNPFLDEMLPENSPMPRQIVCGDGIAVTHGTVNQSYQDMQGSIFDILKFHGDVGVWNELYTEDREDGVHCVYRPAPLLSISEGPAGSNKIQPDAPDPVFVDILDDDVQSINLSRADLNVANFFWVSGARLDMIEDQSRKLMAIPQGDGRVFLNDYQNAAVAFYGLRPMMHDTQQAGDEVRNQASGLPPDAHSKREVLNEAWIDNRRRLMLEMNKDNVVFERGSARIKGGPLRSTGEAMRAGDYARFSIGQTQFNAYVTQIDHEFLPLQGYTTTLSLERGESFIRRITKEGSPYLLEQARRPEAAGS
jgi:hypothetical protein